MSEIKSFEFDGNFYVAYDIDSCIEFIANQEDSYSYEEVHSNVTQVPPNTVIREFVCEEITFNGMRGTATFYDATLSQIYKSLYKDSFSEIPLQIVYDVNWENSAQEKVYGR